MTAPAVTIRKPPPSPQYVYFQKPRQLATKAVYRPDKLKVPKNPESTLFEILCQDNYQGLLKSAMENLEANHKA
jgi:hypothetical protein